MDLKNDVSSIEKAIYKKILTSKKKDNNHKFARKVKIKKSDKIITFFICLTVLLVVFACIYYYNLFVNLEYDVSANLAQIDTQLQKRKNLIINLGTTVIDYSKHERELFSYLGELRATFNSQRPEQTLQALKDINTNGTQNQNTANLSEDLANWEKTLSQLMAIAEQYPDLKLAENFRSFMDAILEFETKIAELRMTYNTSVNLYSTKKDQFPAKVFAAIFRFKDYEYFKLDIDEKDFIEVKY